MDALNFKHLRYFWMVAKTGSIARAADQLHLTPQSISGQLSEFEDDAGRGICFAAPGANRELTDAGRRILSYAEEIFAVGDELLDVLRDQKTQRRPCPSGSGSPIPYRSRSPIGWWSRRSNSANRFGWFAARVVWHRYWPSWRSIAST